MKLRIIVPVLNQFEQTKNHVNDLMLTTQGRAQILFIDNGSEPDLQQLIHTEFGTKYDENIEILRNDENIGVYPTFKQAYEHCESDDILAFFHNDLRVYQANFDREIVSFFENDEKLGLVGFIGSNEIDTAGGRGLGTMSNFQGRIGGPAEVHGQRIFDLRAAAVVDGCAMIFRRETLTKIGFMADFPIHHFYDRVMSLQTLEAGYHIAVFGAACDHVSGQTANVDQKYHELAKRFMQSLGVENTETNWDHEIYKAAEKRFLGEWRDMKKIVPVKVQSDYSIVKTLL